jgi:hypothetical protein
VIHGGARGADSIAANEAVDWFLRTNRGGIVDPFLADWNRFGRGAGPIRNAQMLAEGKPHRGLAFGPLWRMDAAWKRYKPTGTGDMVNRMLAAGLPVRWVAAPGVEAVDLTAMPAPPPLPAVST